MIGSLHLFDSTWNIAETHNYLTILYYFLNLELDIHPSYPLQNTD